MVDDTVFRQIPNEVTDYYLQRVGFETDDVRLYVACTWKSRALLVLTFDPQETFASARCAKVRIGYCS